MGDWEEVKRLAADFQRAQLSSTSHKLSERNCVELVQKLINLGLIDVIYTTDGREYLTPSELEKEIREELFVEGGRINLVDLQQVINVDLSHIESKVAELIKTDRSLVLIQGELIEKHYLDHIAEEINEKLQESGLVSIGELAKTFGFTTDFMLETIEDRLGSIIHGKLDRLERGVLFTDAFIARHTARIRGVLSAITRPTSLSNLIIQYDFQEKLFYTVINDLIEQGRLSGTIQGRQDKANFVPDIYSRTQNAWVDAFYQQNGYLVLISLHQARVGDCDEHSQRVFIPVSLLITCGRTESVLESTKDIAINRQIESLKALSKDVEQSRRENTKVLGKQTIGAEKEVAVKLPKLSLQPMKKSLAAVGRGCVYCDSSDHKANDCQKVTTVADRKQILAKKHLCFNCALGSHQAAKCQSKNSCQKCEERKIALTANEVGEGVFPRKLQIFISLQHILFGSFSTFHLSPSPLDEVKNHFRLSLEWCHNDVELTISTSGNRLGRQRRHSQCKLVYTWIPNLFSQQLQSHCSWHSMLVVLLTVIRYRLSTSDSERLIYATTFCWSDPGTFCVRIAERPKAFTALKDLACLDVQQKGTFFLVNSRKGSVGSCESLKPSLDPVKCHHLRRQNQKILGYAKDNYVITNVDGIRNVTDLFANYIGRVL
ncbi:E3 UFM1- ligase 1, partial [Paramuricea clavata]